MPNLVIFGTGNIARVAKYCFEIESGYKVVAFTLNDSFIKERECMGLPVVPFEDLERLFPPEDFYVFVALGYSKLNTLRQSKYEDFKNKGYKLASYISKKATVMCEEPIGDNTIILEGCVIQCFTKIGANNIFWSGCVICHDTWVKDHVFLASHVVVGGNSVINSNCILGLNATVHNGVEVAERNIIGAGAVISRSTMPGEVYLPARTVKIEKNSDEIHVR